MTCRNAVSPRNRTAEGALSWSFIINKVTMYADATAKWSLGSV
jgi:hypothetical protein